MYPTEHALPMDDECLEDLAASMVGKYKEDFNRAISGANPDRACKAWDVFVQAAEEFLQRRTIGAEGNPGKKGRSGKPVFRRVDV